MATVSVLIEVWIYTPNTYRSENAGHCRRLQIESQTGDWLKHDSLSQQGKDGNLPFPKFKPGSTNAGQSGKLFEHFFPSKIHPQLASPLPTVREFP